MLLGASEATPSSDMAIRYAAVRARGEGVAATTGFRLDTSWCRSRTPSGSSESPSGTRSPT